MHRVSYHENETEMQEILETLIAAINERVRITRAENKHISLPFFVYNASE